MLTALVIAGMVFLGAIVAGVFFTLKARRRLLDAFSSGMAEGAAQPGAEHLPRGAGGFTAAQTTAMANNALGTFGIGKRDVLPPQNPDGPDIHPTPQADKRDTEL